MNSEYQTPPPPPPPPSRPSFMADPESFVRGGPTLTTFVLVDRGREVPNTTKKGHHLPASELPFK